MRQTKRSWTMSIPEGSIYPHSAQTPQGHFHGCLSPPTKIDPARGCHRSVSSPLARVRNKATRPEGRSRAESRMTPRTTGPEEAAGRRAKQASIPRLSNGPGFLAGPSVREDLACCGCWTRACDQGAKSPRAKIGMVCQPHDTCIICFPPTVDYPVLSCTLSTLGTPYGNRGVCLASLERNHQPRR